MKEDRHEKNTYWGPRYMTLELEGLFFRKTRPQDDEANLDLSQHCFYVS